MTTATRPTRTIARGLASAWRHGDRFGRLAVTGLALCLAVISATVAGISLSPASAEMSVDPVPVPADQLAAIRAGALSCPILTAPRLAAQVMAASAFNPRAATPDGAAGVAGLTDRVWRQWKPSPDALRGDAGANIMALAHLVCDLAGHVRANQLAGDTWHLALAAFRSGLPAVVEAKAIPASAAGYVNRVAAYADWYSRQPDFDGTAASLAPPQLSGPAQPTTLTSTPIPAPLPVPDAYVADIVAAGQRCPTVTPARVAAQLMAESAFNPNMLAETGAQGIAQFRPGLWSRYAPSTGASAWDPSAAIRGLGTAMCDLVKQLSGSDYEAYGLALVAFHTDLDRIQQATATAAAPTMRNLVQAVLTYTNAYARDARLSSTAKPATDPDTPAAAAVATGPANWQLTWSDEFNGPAGTAPDPGKWSRDLGGSGWGNSELQHYTDSTANASLDGTGNLAITATNVTSSTLTCWYGPCKYTSARLTTLGRFAQTHGRISARIMLPKGQGIWPSFWALGDNIASAGWPRSGELNIMNSYGSKPATIMGGLHGPDYHAFATKTLPNGTFADGYHTFTADWYPDHVSFYVDSQLYATQYRSQAGAGWVFDHPFFLLLNVAVGGKQPGDPNASTAFPQRMLVDWVRVYRAGPPSSPVIGRITGLAGKCAEVAQSATTGSPVRLNTCTGSTAQTWTFATDGAIHALGGCLAVSGDSHTNGAQVQLAPCSGTPAQKWQVQTNGQLFNLAAGRCLDVTNKSSADHTPLQLWDCWGTANQRWAVS